MYKYKTESKSSINIHEQKQLIEPSRIGRIRWSESLYENVIDQRKKDFMNKYASPFFLKFFNEIWFII